MSLGVKVNDTVRIDGDTYIINETRPNEQDVLRVPVEAKNFLDVDEGNVIQNSRLKEIFEGALITHSYDKDNTSVKEKFFVSSRDKHAYSYEVILDNESIIYSNGIFKNNSTYDIAINNEFITSFNFNDDSNTTFTYDNHTVEIMFKDTNSTSIKQFARSNQGDFLNFEF